MGHHKFLDPVRHIFLCVCVCVCVCKRERERKNLIPMLSMKGNFVARKAQVQTTIYYQTYSYNMLFNDTAWCKDYTTLVSDGTGVWSTGRIILKGKPKYSEKNLSVTFPTTNPTWTGLGWNPVLLNKWPVTNLLSHDIKHVDTWFLASAAMSLGPALAAWNGSSVPTFRDNLVLILEDGIGIGCPETSVHTYHSTARKIAKQSRSHLDN